MKPTVILVTGCVVALGAPVTPSRAHGGATRSAVAAPLYSTIVSSLLPGPLRFFEEKQEEKPPPKETDYPEFYEKQFPEKPAEGFAVYTLSGGEDVKAKIVADDDLVIRLNRQMIFADNDGWKSSDDRGGKWKGEPIRFHARPEDKITLVLYDLLGDEWGIGPIYLHRADGKKAVLQPRINGKSDPDLNDDLFRDQPPGPSAKRHKKLEATWTIKDVLP